MHIKNMSNHLFPYHIILKTNPLSFRVDYVGHPRGFCDVGKVRANVDFADPPANSSF